MINIGNWLNKSLLLAAILLITFFPVITPTVYAVSSWSGDTWEGNTWSGDTWKGNPWDGSSFKWQGESPGASQDGNSGNPWSQSGFDGDGTNGNRWMQEGYEGSPYGENSWLQDGYSGYLGNLSPGYLDGPPGTKPEGSFDSGNITNSVSTPFYDSQGFKAAEYVVSDVLGGQAQLAETGLAHQRYLDAGIDHKWEPGLRMRGDLLVNGFKLAGVDNTVTDTYDTGSTLAEGYEGYQKFKDARSTVTDTEETLSKTKNSLQQNSKTSKLQQGLNKASNLAKAAPVEKVLSKFSVPGAMLGSVASGTGTLDSVKSAVGDWDSSSGSERTASVAGIGENAGNFAMNAGTVALAAPVPGARVAGGIAIAGGAALWGVSKGVKFAANNFDKIKSAASKLGNTVKKTGSAIKDGAQKAWDSVTGLFS